MDPKLALQANVFAALSPTPRTVGQIAAGVGVENETESVYLLLEHLVANGRARSAGDGGPGQMLFSTLEPKEEKP
jgi:hypothetical protein